MISDVKKQIKLTFEGLRSSATEEADRRLKEALEKDETLRELFYAQRRAMVDYVRNKSEANEQAHIKAVMTYMKYLREHNLSFDPKFRCNKCSDTGWIDEEKHVECECRKALKATLLRAESNMPKMATFTFDQNRLPNSTVKQAQKMSLIYKDCEKFVETFSDTNKQTILIEGSVGVGKTTLAYCVANALLNEGHSVYYLTAFELAKVLVDIQFHRMDKETIETHYNLCDAELVVIDDLGVEPQNEVVLLNMFSYIESRITNDKKTFICTNLTLEQISKRYGERLTSRLLSKELSYCPSYIDGDDLRKTIL